jgi:hypothetical protein
MMTSLFHTFHADFKQRVRQQSYLVVLLAMAVLTMLFFPALDANYQTVQINDYRGIYNSAWMGASLALLNVSFLPLICFYLIKGSLEYDRTQHVGELIAASPVSKSSYLLGKWLSNLCLMLGMLLGMSLTVIFVQLWHGEDYAINILQLVLPQILYVVPILVVVAAMAILFECIPWLRGGVGNIVYFFLWCFSLVQMMFGVSGVATIHKQMLADFYSISAGYLPENTAESVAKSAAESLPESVNIGITVAQRPLDTFVWQGLDYSDVSGLPILLTLMVALAMLVIANYLFDRFKQASSNHKTTQQNITEKALSTLLLPGNWIFNVLTQHFAFTRLVRQEFLLISRGWPVWWYAVIIGLVVAQLLVPEGILRGALLPASWLLCVLALSPLGQRESQFDTQQLIFNSPSLLYSQLPAMVIAGTLLLLAVSSGALIRFLLVGDFFSVMMLLSGAVFLVLLALTCGVLTNTSRTFEILFTMLWYIGPLNQLTYIDFIGVDVVKSQQINAPLVFVAVSGLLLVVAYLFRRKQILI